VSRRLRCPYAHRGRSFRKRNSRKRFRGHRCPVAQSGVLRSSRSN